MKTNIYNIYKGIEPKELANLAFQALINHDSDSLNKIRRSVPKKNYAGLDNDYLKWEQNFFNLASYWTHEFWKVESARIYSMGEFKLAANFGDDKEAKEMLELVNKTTSMIFALQEAIEEICKKHDLDPELIYTFSRSKNLYYPLDENVILDESYKELMIQIMNYLFDD